MIKKKNITPKKPQKRILMLNSGGFDSVVLYNILKRQGFKIISLFFDFGQNNLKQEQAVVENLCGEDLIIVKIPPFSWSKSSILDNNENTEDIQNEYVEMRNLIFLSYALSIAEANGIKDIHMAIIKTPIKYTDACESFIEKFNDISLTCGVKTHAILSCCTKEELMTFANEFGIAKNDFFTCHYPTKNGDPCGLCEDCLILEKMYS